MTLTEDKIVTAAALMLRKGQSEAASGIYTYWIRSLLPMALIAMTEQVSNDNARRGRITSLFNIVLVNGVGDIPEASYRQLYIPAMKYSTCYDSGSGGATSKMVWKPNFQDIDDSTKYTNPNYAFYALRNNQIITRGAGGNAWAAGPLNLYAVYIPDLSNDFPLPLDLMPDIMTAISAVAGFSGQAGR